MLKEIFRKFRTYKANIKWTSDMWAISEIARLSKREFHWFRLIYQEIVMYIKIGEKITVDDLQWLITRRGFNKIESNYLKEMLKFIKLYK